MYESFNVLGPYAQPSGRRFVILIDVNGKRKNMNYARFLLSKHLNRELLKTEHVHHINGNYIDDRIENLEILSVGDHTRTHRPKLFFTLVCDECGREKFLEGGCRSRAIANNKASATKNKFCSLSCSIKYNNKKRARIRKLVKEISQLRGEPK